MIEPPLFADARTRAAELFEAYADQASQQLARRYRGVDPQRVADAVVEAVLFISRDWDRHSTNTAQKLTDKARERLRNFMRGESRRKQREQAIPEIQSSMFSLEDHEEAEQWKSKIATTELERKVLDYWLMGRSTPQELAGLLTISLPQAIGILARLRQRIHRLKVRVNRDN
jgi:hypothetical protein